jgi:hypothetical protein
MIATLRRQPKLSTHLASDTPVAIRRRPFRLIAWFAVILGVLVASQLALPSNPAHAGTVGVTGLIQGAGVIHSVGGGPYSCVATGNQDDRKTVTCPRLPFEAVFEAWVWLEATPSDWPANTWTFAGWSGCDTTEVVDGKTRCGVHSGAFTLDERYPKAFFVSSTQVKSIAARHSGMCLDVAGASTAHAADVIQGTCSGGTNQQWTTRPVGGGYYEIVARHSGMCLDVAFASKKHAADVIQGTCSGGTNQQWRFQ